MRRGGMGVRARWRLGALSLTAVVAWMQASCATGAKGDSDSGPSSTQTAGGQGGVGGAGGAVGSGGAAGSGGSDCSEQPCKLMPPQCGCPNGQACQYDSGMRACGAPGSKLLSEGCAAGECAQGQVCTGPPSNIGGPDICFKFCQDDSHCTAPGGQCIFTLAGGESTKLCSQNCDPISDQGCLEPSMKCYLLTNSQTNLQLTSCGAAGSAGEGMPCSAPSDCGKGLMCVQDPNTMTTLCRQWCNVSAPTCAQCVGLNPAVILGVLEYGVCL